MKIVALIRQCLARTGVLITIKKAYYAAETKLHLSRSTALFSHMCGPGSLVFDVGANLGQKTQIFSSIGARVVSIEPERRCCEYMRRRFRRCDRVTIVNAAVSDAPGRLQLFVNPQTPEISTLDRDWLATGPNRDKAGHIEEQLVDVITLTQLIDRFGIPDYIKIDVEGFETHVLNGLTVPVKHVSFEFHVDESEALVECLRIVDRIGDYVFNYTVANSYELALASWVTSSALVDAVIATDKSAPKWGDVVARRNS